MNQKQAEKYGNMVASYEADPRWIRLQAEMETEMDPIAWSRLYQEASKIERAARHSAEQCRVGGYL